MQLNTTTPLISVTLITKNEEKNLPAALDSVRWADEIIVVDSGSTDRTVEIAQAAGAQVFRNPWSGYGQQKNFAQLHAHGKWVLNIDADERVTPALQVEIQNLIRSQTPHQGFSIPRKTFYLGRWIRFGGWYPNRTKRLALRAHSRWSEPPVHEDLLIDGSVGILQADLEHYTFTTIQDQVRANLHYADLGSQALRSRGQKASLIKLLLKPFGKFIETYFIKRGCLDGIAGLIISINAAYSIFLKYAFLFHEKISRENRS